MDEEQQPKPKIRTAYIHLTEKAVETTKEIVKGQVYADFDDEGRIVGFEFLDPLNVEIDGELQ